MELSLTLSCKNSSQLYYIICSFFDIKLKENVCKHCRILNNLTTKCMNLKRKQNSNKQTEGNKIATIAAFL
jgi:hypothetical protein